MKATIKNWAPETLDENWFAENGQERDDDFLFFKGLRLYPLREIPFFFSVECKPSGFVLLMGNLIGAAVNGEIEIFEPETLLSLSSFLASPLNGDIEVTPDWLIDAREVTKFARSRHLYWAGDSCDPSANQTQPRSPDDLQIGATRPSAANKSQNTLLCIIAALCDYSAINYQGRGASGQIARMTEELGSPVTDETILAALKKIPGALEARMK